MQTNLTTMNKFPSVSSIHSMVSLGYLPPGHGYIPKKVKPDKPYGPSYLTIMNRTWRGPGRKYLRYALVAFCLAILFYIAATLYFAHRNVSRVITKHSEPTGACLLIVAICLTSLMIQLIYKARMASNRWRALIRFQADGLFHVVPTNEEYQPRDPTMLSTGTYGPRAVKEIPKPRHMRGSRPGSRPGGRKRNNPMATLAEGDEEPLVDEMGSQDFLDMAGQPGPQQFLAEPMPEVHKPTPQRHGIPVETHQVEKMVPLDRMPPQVRMTPEPRFMQQERMPPPMAQEPRYVGHPRMTPEPRGFPVERMPPMARATPEPRLPPGARNTPVDFRLPPTQERMPAGARQTPDPRLPPTQERMPARQTPEPRLAPTPARAAAGTLKTPDARAAPGMARPPPRSAPGQGRPPAGSGRATPRGVALQGVPRHGMSESDL